MESKHTPGPWATHTNEKPDNAPPHAIMRHVVNSESGKPICALWHRSEPYRNPTHFKAGNFVTDPEESTANARLIAASPELLAVAMMLVDAMDANQVRAAKDAASAAIAKAKGGAA